ncbi:MAG: uncharacterized protein K0S45_1413 [Nitrospira sp.]|nr:uncharacterized protein [Nitrospira sp.]
MHRGRGPFQSHGLRHCHGTHRPRPDRRHGALRLTRLRASSRRRLSQGIRKGHAPLWHHGQGPAARLRTISLAGRAGLLCGDELRGQHGLREPAGHPHQVREAFAAVFGATSHAFGMQLIYDVAHNVAKVERYRDVEWLVHRKGATRAFGPGHPEPPDCYRTIGQPVICGGSMETGSYLLVGTDRAMQDTFGSTMHGSGRTMSRDRPSAPCGATSSCATCSSGESS